MKQKQDELAKLTSAYQAALTDQEAQTALETRFIEQHNEQDFKLRELTVLVSDLDKLQAILESFNKNKNKINGSSASTETRAAANQQGNEKTRLQAEQYKGKGIVGVVAVTSVVLVYYVWNQYNQKQEENQKQ